MSSTVILVPSTHKLSRHFVSTPFLVENLQVSSIHMGFWSVILRQTGRIDLDEKMRNNYNLNQSPAEIQGWLNQRGGRIPSELVFSSRQIYTDILVDQLQQVGSPFHSAFMEITSAVDNPLELRFVVCGSGNEYVWSAGLRVTHCQSPTITDRLPGTNLYGCILEDLVAMYYRDGLQTTFGVDRLFNGNIMANPSYRYTVLVLSDSMCRQLESIDRGHVIPVSGGRFNDLVTHVSNYGLKFGDYNIVIINCGVNDSGCSREVQDKSWIAMENMLVEIHQTPNAPKILVNLPVLHPKKPGVKQLSDWIEARLDSVGIQCINWAGSKSVFTLPNGQPNYDYFDKHDRFHIGHAGIRVLWREWCSHFPEMHSVGYNVSKERCTIKRHRPDELWGENGQMDQLVVQVD